MEHLADFLFEHPLTLLTVPLAFAAFFGLVVSLVLAVGLVWARHVLAERRQEAEERRLEREERRAERASRQAERRARQREREQRRRSPEDVSPRRYVSGEYAGLIEH